MPRPVAHTPYLSAEHKEERSASSWIAALAPWSWFASLTFESEPRDAAAHRAFRSWARRVACDVYRSHLTIAWGHGPQARGVVHFHALVAPHEAEPVELHGADLAAAWSGGSGVDVQAVYSADGAAEYLAGHPSWNVNVACDRRSCCRRRRRGCILAPGPWHALESLTT